MRKLDAGILVIRAISQGGGVRKSLIGKITFPQIKSLHKSDHLLNLAKVILDFFNHPIDFMPLFKPKLLLELFEKPGIVLHYLHRSLYTPR